MLSAKISFFLYSLILLLIGIFSYRFAKDRESYFLGGRRLGRFSTAISACASDMSGWLLLGLPGAVFLYGLNQIWIAVGLVIGSLACWLAVSWRLRCYTEVAGAVTLNEYISIRFGKHKKALSVISGVITLVFFTFYTSSGLVASGVLMEELLEIDYQTALILGVAIVLVYTLMGGFLAVSWTDTLQGTLVIIALVALPLVAFNEVGGVKEMQSLATPAGYFEPFHDMTFLGIVSLMSWGLGYFGQPHVLSRFMGAKSERILSTSTSIALGWNVITLTGSVLVGVIGLSYVLENNIEVDNAETIFLVLTETLVNPWIAGILFAAVLSAILSTIDSQLLVSASVISDLFQIFDRQGKIKPKFALSIGRYSVVVMLVLAYLIAITPGSTILSLVSYAWAGLGCALGPIVVLSLLWRRVTAEGAMAGMLSGAIFVIVFGSKGKLMNTLGLYDAFPFLESWFGGGFFGLYELLPGFIFSAIAVVVVSLATKKPSKEALERFNVCLRG